ncbi:MAG: radical SAM protein [Chloroflexota bacterium]
MSTTSPELAIEKIRLGEENKGYINLLNEQIEALFKNVLQLMLKDPSSAIFVHKTIAWQKQAARVRHFWGEKGVHVPPLLIASITHRCNLHCHGCYARAQHRFPVTEMSTAKLWSVITEAKKVGISIIFIAGGEPLTRPEILDITGDSPEIIFPLFTNGTLMDKKTVSKLKKQRNVVPVISLEGTECETDARRGQGVYEYALNTMKMMKKQGIFFGTSLTLTRENFDVITDESFIKKLMDSGCRLFFFLDYVPVQEGTENLVLTSRQRAKEARLVASFRGHLPGIFIAFPGDEEMFGGCLSAGRGFVHVSPEGNLEPCPAAPYSDTSLMGKSLIEALKSDFLRTIRQNHDRLGETESGCVLWEKRAWVRSLLSPEESNRTQDTMGAGSD